jgi:magnesium-transporting ATPase (P-type)
MEEAKQASRIKRTFIASLGVAAIAALVYGLVRRWKLRSISRPEQLVHFKSGEQGLSEAEAAQRHSGERVQARRLAEQQARRERRQRNIFSIFNLTILVLAISQIVLKDLLGAVATLATLALNIGVNLFQEGRAAKQVEELAGQTRPMATVIREGRLKSIDQDEVVVGDILVAGRGDEILADGTLVESANLTIDQSLLEGKDGVVKKSSGESLQAGMYCASGWAVYRVERLNFEAPGGEEQIGTASASQTLTPLQNIVQRVLYVLLFIAGLFYVSLMLEVVRADILPPETLAAYREVMSIIFSLAPGGLFFMIVINYAVGSANIARSDALVRNSLTIESLAQISTICLIRRGGVLGVGVEIEMLASQSGTPVISESRARQALGNYVHSVQEDQFPLSTLKEEIEGEKRSIDQQARYLSIFGWEATTFSSKDMPGSYVIGDPNVLKPYLLEPKPADQEKDETASSKNGRGGVGVRLRKWLQREKSDSQPAAPETLPDEPDPSGADERISDPGADGLDEPQPDGLLRRLRTRLADTIRRREAGKDQAKGQTDQDQPDEILRLMFAYSPSSQPVYDSHYQPQCPRQLVPVCFVKLVEQVGPEAHKTVQTFLDAGVSIKMLTDDEPTRALAIAEQLGLVEVGPGKAPVLEGEVISQSTPAELKDAAREKSIFAGLTSDQMIQILGALKEQGEYVAVQGSSIADLKIVRQANLSITSQGSSPAMLNQADIILLKNSPDALPEVLQKGQRIVNSLMDVLRLNLTQIIYILILLAVLSVTRDQMFYYRSAQGGAIALFTIVIPSIFLSFWASASAVNRARMQRQLAHFVVPAATMMALTVLLIRSIFSPTAGGIEYTQQAVTHALVYMGLLLVVFVQPPVRFLAGGDECSGDWRLTYVVAVLFPLFQLVVRMPLAQKYLKLAPLASLNDFLLLLGISLVWAVLTLAIWRLPWLKRAVVARRNLPKQSHG